MKQSVPKPNPALEARFYDLEVKRLIKEQSTAEFSIFDAIADVDHVQTFTDPLLGLIKFNLVTVAEQQATESISDPYEKSVHLVWCMLKRVNPEANLSIANIKGMNSLKFTRLSVIFAKLTNGFLEGLL